MKTYFEAVSFPPLECRFSRVLTRHRLPATIPGMRRESSRRVVVVSVVLVTAACTNGAADRTTTTEPSTTSTAIESTTTTAAPMSTTTSEPTTTTTEFTDSVGSPEALAAVMDEAMANSELAFPDAKLDLISLPDLNTPDPAKAAGALARLEYQVSAVAPNMSWLNVVTAPGSPARASLAKGLQELSNRQLRVVLDFGDYVVDHAVTVPLQELSERPIDLPSDVPHDAAFVLVTTSSPSYRLVARDGEIIADRPGWDERTRIVILLPTEVGWQVFWEESA